MQAWVNGHLLDAADAPALSVLDHGLTVGDGAFETIKTVAGEPFALSRHLRRMATSLTGLGIEPPPESVLRAGVEAVLAADDLAGDGKLRLTVTGGRSPLGSERGDDGPTVVVVSDELGEWPATTAGATVPWPRNERGALAGLKSTSYAENVIALAYAHDRGAGEAVFANLRGQLCEGTGSNIFVVVDGELITPTLESGCLAGITRQLVLEWCDVTERDMSLGVLEHADEVFLASTTRDVQGLHRVDERELDAPGPVTAQTAKVFAQRSQENVDP